MSTAAPGAGARARALEMVRSLCAELAGVEERTSHGAPSFFVGRGGCIAMFQDDHHGDGRLALWCAAGPGVAASLVERDPHRFFIPPYVGGRGWVGVNLAEFDDDVADLLEDAWRLRAPKRLLGGPGGL